MDKEEKALQLIGLATRAGHVSKGMDATLAQMERGKVQVLILSKDIGESSKKKIMHKLQDYAIPYLSIGTHTSLGKFSGCRARSVLGITEENLSRGICKLFEEDLTL